MNVITPILPIACEIQSYLPQLSDKPCLYVERCGILAVISIMIQAEFSMMINDHRTMADLPTFSKPETMNSLEVCRPDPGIEKACIEE